MTMDEAQASIGKRVTSPSYQKRAPYMGPRVEVGVLAGVGSVDRCLQGRPVDPHLLGKVEQQGGRSVWYTLNLLEVAE